MKKIIYIKPEVEVTMMLSEGLLREYSVAVDKEGLEGGGSSTPIIDEDPDEIFGKDGSNMWDGWDE